MSSSLSASNDSTVSPSSSAARAVRGDVATQVRVSRRRASAGKKWATVEPVPRPRRIPSATRSAARLRHEQLLVVVGVPGRQLESERYSAGVAVTRALVESRWSRLRSEMDTAGLDGLLLAGRGILASYGYVVYAAGYTPFFAIPTSTSTLKPSRCSGFPRRVTPQTFASAA